MTGGTIRTIKIHKTGIGCSSSPNDIDSPAKTVLRFSSYVLGFITPGLSPQAIRLGEKDITTVDAILFVQNSLKESSDLYNKGKYEASWRNYIKRGNEFLTKYSRLISSSQSNKLGNVILDDQPVAQLAREAWTSRNVFRDLLRELEQKEDRIVDSYLMQLPQKARFGR